MGSNDQTQHWTSWELSCYMSHASLLPLLYFVLWVCNVTYCRINRWSAGNGAETVIFRWGNWGLYSLLSKKKNKCFASLRTDSGNTTIIFFISKHFTTERWHVFAFLSCKEQQSNLDRLRISVSCDMPGVWKPLWKCAHKCMCLCIYLSQ